jgi:glycosyltransferase involved in cell wall biosynthesis
MEATVSVIIPTYNRQSFLKRAVASCFEGNQALDIEVIVVDDGSSDETRAWMESLDDDRIVYVRQENQGAPVARNQGLERAQGRYLKFLDDDDYLSGGELVEEVRALDESGAAVCCGNLHAKSSDSEDFVFNNDPSPDLAAGIFRGDVVTYPLVFTYRSEAVEDIRWDPALRFHQDTDFAVRVASKGLRTFSLDRVIGTWNDHEGERIKTRVKYETEHAEIVRRRLATVEMGIDRLQENGALQKYHRRAAAHGIWEWAHIVAASDLQCFQDCMDVIYKMNPDFIPSRTSRLLGAMDQIVGPSRTEKALFPLRWIKHRFSG